MIQQYWVQSTKREDFRSIQSEMDNLMQWFCQNRLGINRDKSQAIIFGRCHPSENFILGKNLLVQTRPSVHVFTWTKRCASNNTLITL